MRACYKFRCPRNNGSKKVVVITGNVFPAVCSDARAWVRAGREGISDSVEQRVRSSRRVLSRRSPMDFSRLIGQTPVARGEIDVPDFRGAGGECSLIDEIY